jgi:zinc transporter ZupT
MRRGVPPVEELSFERVVLSPNLIEIDVVNGGPDPVTVAQVSVDEAFWEFSIEPSATITRLGRATLTLPYPWVKDDAHEITVLTSSGVTFSHEIEVATITPKPGARYFGVFALIGLFVGVIPVGIGLLWYQFIRRLDRRWIHFGLALTGGLLIFLGADALHEAFESASKLASAYHGETLVVVGTLGTLLVLQMISRSMKGRSGVEERRAVAFLIALGIGLHNLGEGLAIGAAYSLGQAALGTFLIVGFMLHNTTEGLAIVVPIAKDRPKLMTLVTLGAIAGAPTVLGTWIGGLAYSPLFATLFLAVGAGAIAQVLLSLYGVVAKEAEGVVVNPLTASGVLAGLLLMYGTGLLVSV